MAITKEEKSFTELTNLKLSMTSRIRMFDILKDWNDTRFLNIFKTFGIPEDVRNNANFYSIYEAEAEDWWDLISYKHYNTVQLWWVVCFMNKITNPFEEIDAGQQIKILREKYLYVLYSDMGTISRL
jgi:hypothetical protein